MSMLQSKVPLMELHLSANLALFVTDQCPVNGTPPVSQLSLVKMPIPSTNVVSSSLYLHLFLCCFLQYDFCQYKMGQNLQDYFYMLAYLVWKLLT